MSRPQLPLGDLAKIIHHRLGTTPGDRFAVVAIRGYYLNSMGNPSKNDRGIYDDAFFVVERINEPVSNWIVRRYNGNTDPSLHREGIANLAPGNWRYKIGIHGLSKPKSRQYWACVQAAPVTVVRDGGATETGYFGINIHRGGSSGTSSLGCQTIPPTQWPSFYADISRCIRDYKQKDFYLVLIDENDRRKYL